MTHVEEKMNAELQSAFIDFVNTIRALRHPKTGCPWDLQQTHQTLRKYMLEEAYEAIEAMGGHDTEAICEELGDVLLQVFLNAQIAADASSFSLQDVMVGINNKMQRRHPHVFAPETLSGLTAEEVKIRWQQIKADEKNKAALKRAARGESVLEADKGVFQRAGCHKVRPSTSQAAKIGEMAAKIDFDWNHADEVLDQVMGEITELKNAIKEGKRASVESELGDVYFSLAQLCRHLGFEPELVALGGNDKFLKRFSAVERRAEESGIDVTFAGFEVLERLWLVVKEKEKS